MKNTKVLFILASLVLAQVRAVTITGYSATANDRFSSGFPSSPVQNSNVAFVGANYDWSGVGWASSPATKGFGFVSPQHYLVATHFGGSATIVLSPESGMTVSAAQQSVSQTGFGLQSGTSLPNPDLSLGKLTAPVSQFQQIARYAVLDLYSTSSSTAYSVYNGQTLMVYGRGTNSTTSPRIAVTTINSASNTQYQNPNLGYMIAKTTDFVFESGDSGSPAFIPWTNPNGGQQLTIIGNNAAVDTANGNNLMNFIGRADVMNQLNTMMTPDGFALRVDGNVSNTWVGSSSQNISNRGAWGLSAPAAAPSDVYVMFNAATASNRSVNVDSNRELRGLYFRETGSTSDGFTFGGSSTLTIGRGGVTNYDNSRQVFNAALTLGDHQYWDVGAGGVTVNALNTNAKLLEVAGAGTARFNGIISGSGGLAVTGARVELAGSNSYTGGTWVHAGVLNVEGSIHASSPVRVGAYGRLEGSGTLGAVSGSGRIDPGNSPGILTASSVDPSGGLDFHFEFTAPGSPLYGNASASVNDVLRLTGGTPFSSSLTAANEIHIYLDVATLSANDTFRGGFYTDNSSAFLSSISNASFIWYLANLSGDVSYNSVNYSLYSGPLSFLVSTVAETANFGSGPIAGQVMQFAVIPEAGTLALLGIMALAALLIFRPRFGRRI